MESTKKDHVYEIQIGCTFDQDNWHVVNMLMDYCNNLGLMKESMLKVDLQGQKVIITTIPETPEQ